MVKSSLEIKVGRDDTCKEAEASESIARQSKDGCWILRSLEDTLALGEFLLKSLPDLKLLMLKGPLGAGKTSLVKGMATSLGIKEPVTSPSFALAQHYPDGIPPLIHIDLYRLEDPNSANELFLQEEETANSLGALMVVEWPERLSLSIPEAWVLELSHMANGERFAQLAPPSCKDRKDATSSVNG